MPIIGGILKNGERVLTENFFNGNCQDPGFPLTFIKEALKSREWDGKPHVTSLLNGTRESYLKNVSKYFIDLDKAVIPMAGTRFHSNMEDDVMLTEIQVELSGVQGTMDLLEFHPWDGTVDIVDYKLVGSFRMIKWFGISKRQVPVLDDYGNPVFIKTGKNKGQPKTVNEHYVNEDNKDQHDYTMQVNIYRLAIEKMLADKDWQNNNPDRANLFNKKVDNLKIFFALRDSTINHDFSFNSFYETCERFEDEMVLDFVKTRSQLILDAMANWKSDIDNGVDRLTAAFDNCPEMCSRKETWDGKKCEKYCDVREACKKMRDIAMSKEM